MATAVLLAHSCAPLGYCEGVVDGVDHSLGIAIAIAITIVWLLLLVERNPALL